MQVKKRSHGFSSSREGEKRFHLNMDIIPESSEEEIVLENIFGSMGTATPTHIEISEFTPDSLTLLFR